MSIDLFLDEDEDDLPQIPPLEDDEEVKLEPEETIAKKAKLNSQKRKNEETGLKILTRNQMLSRLPIF